MHEETGYTFNGSAPIAGLTLREDRLLQLGHMIRAEQAEQQADTGNASTSSAHRDAKQQAKSNARERFLNSAKQN